MLRKFGLAIYRGFFWTYERGTWQYDVMVILILAFIFLSPREWFGDQPPPFSVRGIVLLQNEPTYKVYQLPASVLDVEAGGTVEQSAQRVLRIYTNKSVKITRIEPAMDSSGQVVSYAVWVRE